MKDAEIDTQPSPNDILRLAARVYEGLSAEDVEEIEEMARHQAFFTEAQ